MSRFKLLCCLVVCCGLLFWGGPFAQAFGLSDNIALEARARRSLQTTSSFPLLTAKAAELADALKQAFGMTGTSNAATGGTTMAPATQPQAVPSGNAASSDPVALAAAKALGTQTGGINIVSSAPVALSNPIDVLGGTGQYSKGTLFGLG